MISLSMNRKLIHCNYFEFERRIMNPYILSIDAGTTGITIVILNDQAKICKKYYREFTQYYPKPGWVEHDGEEI